MRKALLGAIALILVSAALAKSSFDGVMTISYGFFTDADGRRISLVGREVPFTIERGMRIAQLVVAPVRSVVWSPVDDLSGTARSDGGFGSTG